VTEPRDLDEEREFQDFLRRKRSPFPRDTAAEEPPAELDLIVLGHARQAIESDTGTVRPRAISWLVPFATAATVVIAFAMFRDVGEQAANTSASREVAAAASSTEAAGAPPATLERLEQTASTTAPQLADNAASAVAAPALTSRATPKAPAPTSQIPAASAPPPVSPRAAPLINQSAPVPAESMARDAARATTRAAPAREEDASEIVVKASGAAEARQSSDKNADYSTSESIARSRASGASASAAAPAAEKVRDPDVWWAAIEVLRASGKTAEADRELVEFRRLYPNYQPPRPPPPATEAIPSPAP
jgi:hypothetical protein